MFGCFNNFQYSVGSVPWLGILRLPSGGAPSGFEGKLADTNQDVTLHVLPNDDPYGLFKFPPSAKELTVAEDFLPGDEAATVAHIPVVRGQGATGKVAVRKRFDIFRKITADDHWKHPRPL